MTGILVKIPRNICSLSQVKFLVAVNLFVSRSSHNPFPKTMVKSSGERRLNLRLQRMKYNTKFSVIQKIYICAD
jgi:hypothetical protein